MQDILSFLRDTQATFDPSLFTRALVIGIIYLLGILTAFIYGQAVRKNGDPQARRAGAIISVLSLVWPVLVIGFVLWTVGWGLVELFRHLPKSFQGADGTLRDAFGWRKKPVEEPSYDVVEMKTARSGTLDPEQLRTYVEGVIASDPEAPPLEIGTKIHEAIERDDLEARADAASVRAPLMVEKVFAADLDAPPQVGDIAVAGPTKTTLFPKEGTELLVAQRSSKHFDALDSAGDYFPYFDDNAQNGGQTYSLKCRAADVPAKDAPATPEPPQVGDIVITGKAYSSTAGFPDEGSELRVEERSTLGGFPGFRVSKGEGRSEFYYDDNEYNNGQTYRLKCRAKDVPTTPVTPEPPPQVGDIVIIGKPHGHSSIKEGAEMRVIRRGDIIVSSFTAKDENGHRMFFNDDNDMNIGVPYTLKCRAADVAAKDEPAKDEPAPIEPALYKPQPGDTIKVGSLEYLGDRPAEGTVLKVTKRGSLDTGFSVGDEGQHYYNDDNDANGVQKYTLVSKASDVVPEAPTLPAKELPPQVGDTIVVGEIKKSSYCLSEAKCPLPPKGTELVVTRRSTFESGFYITRSDGREKYFCDDNANNMCQEYTLKARANVVSAPIATAPEPELPPQVGDIIVQESSTGRLYPPKGTELRVVKRDDSERTFRAVHDGSSWSLGFFDDNADNMAKYSLKCRAKDAPAKPMDVTGSIKVPLSMLEPVEVKSAAEFKKTFGEIIRHPQVGDWIKVGRAKVRDSGYPRAGTVLRVVSCVEGLYRFYAKECGGKEYMFNDNNASNSVQEYTLLKSTSKKTGRKPPTKGRTRRVAR